jgi:hypothetical protein
MKIIINTTESIIVSKKLKEICFSILMYFFHNKWRDLENPYWIWKTVVSF